MNKQLVIKKAALQLIDPLCFAKASEDEKPKLKMTAYSGKIIKNHWYWGDLAIDVSGISFSKKKIPVLEDHLTERKIGFATKFTQNGSLEVEESEFVDTTFSQEFIRLSKQGFPYEASIYARPTIIEELADGESAEVNGYTFKGPGTIWRKSQLREVSVTTFGYDSQTKSAAMSEDENIAVESNKEENTKKEVPMKVTLEQFKAESPEEYAKLCTEIRSEVETKFSADLASKEAEIGQLKTSLKDATEEKDKLSTSNAQLSERISKIEKAEVLRAEREIRMTAEGIFDAKLKEAGIPERLFGKVKKQISHEKFITEGVFDTGAFSKAVDDELKDWAGTGDSSVQGFASHLDQGASDMMKEDTMVDRMVGYTK